MSAPATPALCRQIAFFALGPLLCFSLKDLPPLEGMNPDGMVCLAGCAWLMLWWMTEVLPLPVTSLMAVPIFGFLGVMAPDKVFATIGHPAMMLIFGATIIVGVWKESNLIERYAYWCFNLPFVRGNPVRMVLIFTFGAGVMSAIAPNIPLTILFISIAVAIGKSCNLAPDNNMMRSLCTLSAIAPALGGVGTPLGGAPNIVVIAIVATVLGHDITFWEWSALGMPLVFVTLFACFAITALLFPVGKAGKGFSMPEDYLKKKIEALGPVSAHEHAAIWIMVVALALWCSGPQIFSALGLKEEARMMTAPVIAVLMGASAFLVPIRRDRESGRLIFAMNWDQAVRNIGWGIIVLQIGAIAFGQVLLKGGVDKWMAQCIQMLLGDIHGLLVWFALVFITGFFSQIIMSLAVIPLMLPITAGLAGIYGFDPLLACISVGFVSNLTTMFPFSSVPVAAVIAGSEGYAQPKDFIISGFLNTTIVTVITFGLCWLVGPMVL